LRERISGLKRSETARDVERRWPADSLNRYLLAPPAIEG
jgi:hypothetical protein